MIQETEQDDIEEESYYDQWEEQGDNDQENDDSWYDDEEGMYDRFGLRSGKFLALVIIALVIMSTFAVYLGTDIFGSDDDKKANLPAWKDGYNWLYLEIDEESNWTHETLYSVNGGDSVNNTTCYGYYRHIYVLDDYYERPYIYNDPLPIDRNTLNELDDDEGTPRFIDFRWPLEDGKRWNNSGAYFNQWIGNYSVSYEKDVKTLAGTFDCLKIHGELENGNGDYTNRTLWYSEKVKNVVKYRYEMFYDDWYNNETGELKMYCFSDSDGDTMSNTFEKKFMHSDHTSADTDSDGVLDNHDMSLHGNFYLRLNITNFQTQDNDEYDNGNNPSDCDPYFVVGLSDWDNQLDSQESPHFQDQNTIPELQFLFDIPDDGLQPCYSFFGIACSIFAYDDDSNDETDINGDDPVEVDEETNGDECSILIIASGKFYYHSAWDELEEGTTLSVTGSGYYGNDGHVCGGSMDVTYTLLNEDELIFQEPATQD